MRAAEYVTDVIDGGGPLIVIKGIADIADLFYECEVGTVELINICITNCCVIVWIIKEKDQ